MLLNVLFIVLLEVLYKLLLQETLSVHFKIIRAIEGELQDKKHFEELLNVHFKESFVKHFKKKFKKHFEPF